MCHHLSTSQGMETCNPSFLIQSSANISLAGAVNIGITLLDICSQKAQNCKTSIPQET